MLCVRCVCVCVWCGVRAAPRLPVAPPAGLEGADLLLVSDSGAQNEAGEGGSDETLQQSLHP